MAQAANKSTAEKAFENNPFEALTSFDVEPFKASYEKVAENFSTFAEFQKHSFDAFLKSSNAYMKGFDRLNAENAAFLKACYDESVAVAKTASTANNVQDAFEANSEFVRSQVEKNMTQVNKVNEIVAETAKETAEPLNERYSALVEKIQAFRP